MTQPDELLTRISRAVRKTQHRPDEIAVVLTHEEAVIILGWAQTPATFFTVPQVEEMLKCPDCTGYAVPCTYHEKQVWGSIRL